jgi:cell volume regulation protein A
MESLTPYLIAISALLILSVLVSKGAGRFGIPALSIFLLLGMVVGREGPGGFPLSNYLLAQTLGILALILILHSGGLSTTLDDVRAVRGSALVLSTLGVVVATALVGTFSVRFLDLDWLHGLLLGAAVSSTDVAAVFTVLRSRNVSLQGRIRPLLELESALNDPMTVFLSVGLLQLIVQPGGASLMRLIPTFFQQMIVGTLAGVAAGKGTRWAINWITLEFEGLYPVLSVALVVLTYGVTQSIGGSGFLAVYVSGIVLGNETYVNKRSLTVFHDGLAWLMQIVMFLTMGLLVLPSELSRVAVSGIALSGFLVFVARPVSVLLCLTPFRFSLRDQLMVSWAGLRGAVPIVVATYPLIAGASDARTIFNLVFFVVFISVLLQGTSVPLVSKWLGVAGPLVKAFRYPIEYNPTDSVANELVEVPVPDGSTVIGRALGELALPTGALIVLIRRNDDVLVPRGTTQIESRDTLLVLAEREALDRIRVIVSGSPTPNSPSR